MSASNSTPTYSLSSHSNRSFRTLKPPPPLTKGQQDRQARNKDPFASDDESDDSEGGWGGRWDAYGNDTYANTQLRRDAAIKLDNPELVMMLAQSRNDSIPATRNYLTRIMCGFLTAADIEAEEVAEKEAAEAKNRGEGGSGSGSKGLGTASGSGGGGSGKKKRVSRGVDE
ncbi:hypothetical protein GLAREA_03607 [Glarea lozoyensis ATCC 20868]|uniref:Uncharacterized protein n=1 Tax=Glarea lozoyensis (strain ATCC 20868 / MF5171) TaxID=1116229 RepID=S3CYF3_GLAL2|nr:uncharacterized protein GLAREA_03607 [Glarea lozoyensis ATCC 20868]EPE30640.1 hypothetical protein GLAREA_03607 [Glarea lozoyensis ATCC 20868]